MHRESNLVGFFVVQSFFRRAFARYRYSFTNQFADVREKPRGCEVALDCQTSTTLLLIPLLKKAQRTAATATPCARGDACWSHAHPLQAPMFRLVKLEKTMTWKVACTACDAWHALLKLLCLTMKLDFWVVNWVPIPAVLR